MQNNPALSRQQADNPVLGVGAMLLSVILFSMMDATVKWLGGTYPTQQIMFFRCLVAMIPVAIINYTRGGLSGILIIVASGLYTLHREMLHGRTQI